MDEGIDTRTAGALESPPRPNLHRVCSECGKQLRPKPGRKLRTDAKTCGARCRTNRSRRLRRLKYQEKRLRQDEERGIDRSVDGQGTSALAPMVDTRGGMRVRDILARTFQEELRPIIREQITEETLRAIQRLVALTPVMVEAIGRDLEHPDPKIHQRAYSVLARYTLGHTAIVTPPEEASRRTMTVIFDGMVRPGQDPAPEPIEAKASEPPRVCNSCDQTKPAVEFVERSDRCIDCHNELQARMRKVLGEEGDGLA